MRISLPKIAALLVAGQLVLSAVAIGAYLVAQPSQDWIPSAGPLASIFKSAFPISNDNERARAMFDGLFIPLSYVYVFSIVLVAATLSRELGDILREPKRYWPLLALIIVHFGGSWAFLFGPTEYTMATRFKRQILNGDVLGYLAFFCGGAILSILILLSLPSEKNRGQR